MFGSGRDLNHCKEPRKSLDTPIVACVVKEETNRLHGVIAVCSQSDGQLIVVSSYRITFQIQLPNSHHYCCACRDMGRPRAAQLSNKTLPAEERGYKEWDLLLTKTRSVSTSSHGQSSRSTPCRCVLVTTVPPRPPIGDGSTGITYRTFLINFETGYSVVFSRESCLAPYIASVYAYLGLRLSLIHI